MIPVKFVMEFGDKLFDVATLTTPNGHLSQVGFEKENKEIWFDDSRQEFILNKYFILIFFFDSLQLFFPSMQESFKEDKNIILRGRKYYFG
jgi:hypothetical protein